MKSESHVTKEQLDQIANSIQETLKQLNLEGMTNVSREVLEILSSEIVKRDKGHSVTPEAILAAAESIAQNQKKYTSLDPKIMKQGVDEANKIADLIKGKFTAELSRENGRQNSRSR
jgi:hypothetical protein